MSEISELLAQRALSKTAKATMILAHLGGEATTRGIVDAGVANGLREIKNWRVDKIFAATPERVRRFPTGWRLLPSGWSYVQQEGYQGSSPVKESDTPSAQTSAADRPRRIALGHGRSLQWRVVKDFLQERLRLTVDEFNSQSVVGLSTKERLSGLLSNADAAVLVLTAEDELATGDWTPRMNVVHEVGLFQGRLGFEKVAVMLEEGCSEFSNIAGLGQIRFPKGDVAARSEELRQWLSREQMI